MSQLPQPFSPPTVLHASVMADSSIMAGLLGARFRVAAARPVLTQNALYPEEQRHIAGAVDKRQAEFATARVLARSLLVELGVTPCALVPHRDRAPFWPLGILGSISHMDSYCAVALTAAPDVRGIGLDVETDTDLAPDLESLICTAGERVWLAEQDAVGRGKLGKLLFSAKEAFYKCQYATTRTFLDFTDVDLTIDIAKGRFTVAGIARQGAGWGSFLSTHGRFGRIPGGVITTAVLLSTDPPLES